jgi:thiol:disulfide interchange protein DsbD
MMSRFMTLGMLLLAAAAVAPVAYGEDDLLTPDKAFQFSAAMVAPGVAEVRYRIADGYYMYRDRFRFSAQPAAVQLGAPQMPPGKVKEDEYFGKVETYRHEVAIRVPVTAAGANELTLQATSQGCADAGLCYSPFKQSAHLVLAAADTSSGPATAIDTGGALSKLRALTGPQAQDEFLPVEKAFVIEARAVDAQTIAVQFTPQPSYYLYRDKVGFELPQGAQLAIAKVDIPCGEPKSDPNFGETEVFHRPFEAILKLDRKNAHEQLALPLTVRYQGCSEKGLCYPPSKKSVELKLAGWQPPAKAAGPDTPAGSAVPPAATPVEREAVVPSAGGSASKSRPVQAGGGDVGSVLRSGSFWGVIATFFGAGILLGFTPCILPMVPILSGIIVGQGHKVRRGTAVALTLTYTVGMAITYAIAGVAAGLSGGMLSAALQNPWVLGSFAVIFIALALSMFGLYDLQLPSALQSKLSDTSNRLRGGTIGGVFVMGVLSALIVGPCVAAPLAGALLYISQTHDALLGGSALFAMAMGMGMPLLAVGISAEMLLPKVGAWMNTVKRLFGVMLLGLAIWIVSPVIPPVLHMLLWAVLLIVSAIYLHAVDPLPHNASGYRRLWKGVGVLALLLGVALLIGVLSGGRDILQPLAGLRTAGVSTGVEASGPAFERVRSVSELQARIAAANKPVMLDFYADWCVSCKEMERFTFSDPRVRSRMSNMLLLQADVTRNSDEDAELLKKFGLFGPPGIIFFGPQGREHADLRVIGFQSADDFLTVLEAVGGAV